MGVVWLSYRRLQFDLTTPTPGAPGRGKEPCREFKSVRCLIKRQVKLFKDSMAFQQNYSGHQCPKVGIHRPIAKTSTPARR